jgi:hypothetical protein
LSEEEYERQLQVLEVEELREQTQVNAGLIKQSIQKYQQGQIDQWNEDQRKQEEQKKRQLLLDQQRVATQQKLEQDKIRLESLQLENSIREAEEQQKERERKEQEKMMQPKKEYADREIPKVLAEMRTRAATNRSLSSIAQVSIIVASTVAAGIVNVVAVPRFVTSVLTILVAIVTGIIGIFKFKEKSINSQQTADAIEYQRNLYRLGIKDYAEKTPEEAYVLFAERVEDLRNEQNKRQQLLEQTSDRHITSTATAP